MCTVIVKLEFIVHAGSVVSCSSLITPQTLGREEDTYEVLYRLLNLILSTCEQNQSLVMKKNVLVLL